MKKMYYLPIIAICAVLSLFCVSICAYAQQEQEIAAIGEYKLTESTLKEYILLASTQDSSSNSVELAAEMYARAQIAINEIAGTSYDIPANCEKELLALERDNFQQDYEANMEFCEKNGITREELIRTVVTSKINTIVQGKHFSMVIDEFFEADKDNRSVINYSSSDLLAIYNEYVDNKTEALKFIVLDSEKIDEVESYMVALDVRATK